MSSPRISTMRAFSGSCMSLKNVVCRFRMYSGTGVPHRPQNLWPDGTGVMHDSQT